jgi:uncharacterized protein YigE (DUF2233 family)
MQELTKLVGKDHSGHIWRGFRNVSCALDSEFRQNVVVQNSSLYFTKYVNADSFKCYNAGNCC